MLWCDGFRGGCALSCHLTVLWNFLHVFRSVFPFSCSWLHDSPRSTCVSAGTKPPPPPAINNKLFLPSSNVWFRLFQTLLCTKGYSTNTYAALFPLMSLIFLRSSYIVILCYWMEGAISFLILALNPVQIMIFPRYLNPSYPSTKLWDTHAVRCTTPNICLACAF